MKRLFYIFALLFVTLGAMAHNLPAGLYIYFEKPSDWNTSVFQFMIGHGSYSEGRKMTLIANTNLYYWKTVKWDNYTQWAVFGNNSEWGSENSSVSSRHQWSTNKTTVGTTAITANYNLVTTAGKVGSYGSSYTFLNTTHTIKTQLDNTDTAIVGDVSTTYYELTAVSTATQKTSSIKSASSGKISVVYTSQVTLEATPADGYVFVGWYDNDTHLSGDKEYSYQAENSGKTIIAKFVKSSKKTIYLKPSSTWLTDNARFTAYFYGGESGEIWIDMIDNDGDGIYECEIPEGYTQVIFCRMNPSASANNWNNNNKWNQTGDLVYDGNYNLFVVPNDQYDGAQTRWSKFLEDGSEMFFALPEDWNKEATFMIGRSDNSSAYTMTNIPNTNLYYKKMATWSDYNEWAVFNVSWSSNENNSISHRGQSSEKETSICSDFLTKCNLLCNDNCVVLSSYLDLNHIYSINVTTDNESSSAGGSVSAFSCKLSSANATTQTNGTTSIEAAYTATITLTATSNDGYEFVGWYDGDKQLSSDAIYSYIAPNSAETISAKFRELASPEITSFSASPTEIDLGEQITFSVKTANTNDDVVFKCGETEISNPWTPTEGGEYTITANLEGAISASVDVKVYYVVCFDNTISNWSNVYAYCWIGDDKNAEWPGVKLEKPAEGNVYTYRTTQSFEKIIFNNGFNDDRKKQTEDFDFVHGSTYLMPNPLIVGTKNLTEGSSDWEVLEENRMEGNDGVFVKVYENLPKGEYKFKIIYENVWLGYYNRFSSEYSSTCTNDNEDNIQFALDKQATVIISYRKSTDKIEVRFVYNNFTAGEEIYFSSKNKGSLYAAYLFGESGETWVNLSQEYANIYSATVPEGNWGGVVFCNMKSETLDRTNINSHTNYFEYADNDWYIWGNDNDDAHDNDSYWRNFENLIFAGKTLYFKPDENWATNNARFAAYYWDVLGENEWADCVYNEEAHAYEVVAPTVVEGTFNVVWTNIKFVRMNPNYEENGWNDDKIKDRVWNETPDLVYNGTEDFFLIKFKEEDKDKENWWNLADPNNWIAFGHPFKNVIFFEPNQSLKEAESKRFSVYFWNGFGENCWAKMDRLSGYDTEYYCVVVPEGYYTGANICSMTPDKPEDVWSNKILQTDNLTYHDDKLLYIVPSDWTDEGPTDEYWTTFEPKSEVKDIAGGVESGVYYQSFVYNLTISGEDVKKWHWISLPYDVNVKDIKSNTIAEIPYGTDFIMKRYDTANRAAWTGEKPPVNDNTWVQLEATDVLKAGRGYILGVNNSLNSVTLTFPANGNFHVVTDKVNANNLDYSEGLPVNSNWHLIGTGLYGETTSKGTGATEVNYVAYPTESGSDYTYHCLGNSEWTNLDQAFQEQLGTETGVGKLEKYKAFFVQHTGGYSFSKAVAKQNMAPRRARAEEVVEQYYINIVGEKDTARTAIFLADDGADEYVVGKDFLHFGVTGQTAQLYTKQASSLLAFNHLKRENRVVDLGGYMVNAGEYTISMVDNGEALVVLIDSYTGESVDLTTDSYTFTTEKGSLDGRFSLVISYVEKDVTTEIGNEMAGDLVVSNNGGLVVVDGLSVGSVVWIYDAVGRCVNRFVADSEQQELNICAGVYVLKTSTESVKFVVW